ncbi:somatomedin-B and thrombospondin type-1 domain-containing protein [Clinocottus analis]|uniref:somatomedin-B and thrombospondin type-1 domain-containing protein n=1 Tax=Clinocottus analis TaxID=304258 RepID=UPI0035C1FEAB
MTVGRSSSVSLVCLGVSLFLVGPCQSGCRETGVCCTGRDPSCISKGWRSDRFYGPCYCDQACVSTLDCCHDYKTACPALSCVVSEWTEWSGCAEPCRATVRRRSRTILQQPLNAGRPCPNLEEQAGCAEYWSQQGNCHNPLVPALIITGGYGNARKKRDIHGNSDIIGYCVQFQLTSLTKGCQQSSGPHTQWMQHLREGHYVCVECQPPALAAGQTHCAGDGEEKEEGRRQSLQWQAVGNPRCRGVWRRVGRLEACSCPTAHSFLFI